MPQPPLNALRAFEAVARTGSFRAAAEDLCVTQSAISHQIKHLEDWLGVSLFDRSGRTPRLLPRAIALARDLTTAFDGIDAACRRARPASADGAVVVAVTLPRSSRAVDGAARPPGVRARGFSPPPGARPTRVRR